MRDRAVGQGEGQAGAEGVRGYLEDRVYRWKAPHGGHSDDLRHQVSPQKMRLQLVHLEISAADPAFGQEPDHRGIRGQEKRWRGGSHARQLELKRGPESGTSARRPQVPSLACLTRRAPSQLLSFAHLTLLVPSSFSNPLGPAAFCRNCPHGGLLRPHFPFGPRSVDKIQTLGFLRPTLLQQAPTQWLHASSAVTGHTLRSGCSPRYLKVGLLIFLLLCPFSARALPDSSFSSLPEPRPV